MRIIAGRAKGRRLKGPPSDDTRPMTDRAREALFSSIGAEIEGATVLDLFAGTGSLGLEALSRGAVRAVFVERNRHVGDVLRSNIEKVGLGGDIRRADVATFLNRPPEPFDVVFVDPPYAMGTEQVEQMLMAIAQWTPPGALIVLHRRKGDPDPRPPMNLAVEHDRSYGGTHLIRYRREGK